VRSSVSNRRSGERGSEHDDELPSAHPLRLQASPSDRHELAYAFQVGSCTACGTLRQAERMVSGIRNQVLALAGLRHELTSVYGVGVDELPQELLGVCGLWPANARTSHTSLTALPTAGRTAGDLHDGPPRAGRGASVAPARCRRIGVASGSGDVAEMRTWADCGPPEDRECGGIGRRMPVIRPGPQ